MWSPDSIPRSTNRLIVGLALSVLAHLALIAGVRPMVAAYVPFVPLEVEIRHLATEPDAPFSSPAPSDYSADAAMAPAEARKIEPTPPDKAAVPDPRFDPRLPLEHYYTARELDVRAEPLNDVALVYPQLAYQQRIRGKVTLRILINERGGIDQVSVLESEPRDVFEEAALTATRALEFSPALKNGRRVKSQKTIEVTFDPYESINIP